MTTVLCFSGCHSRKSSLAEVECCGRKEDVQSFPSEVKELISNANPNSVYDFLGD
jgi:hypothetical protein